MYGAHIVHTALKRGMTRVLDDAGCKAVAEPAHLLGDALTRPGDVAVMDFEESNTTLAIDVSCARIMTADRLVPESAEAGSTLLAAETRKYDTYKVALQNNPSVHFVPMVVNEYGATGDAGDAFITGLALRTATRRIAARSTTATLGTLNRQLNRRWQGFMAAELHSAIARGPRSPLLLYTLARRATQRRT